MKSVLISIQPKWCELIASGKKTVEVRKTKPKLKTPFKCYIYETKGYDTLFGKGKPKKLCVSGGRVIGEFVCDEITEYEGEFYDDETYENIRKVIHTTDWDGYPEIDYDFIAEDGEENSLCKFSCLTWEELRNYMGEGINTFFGWHISDLVIYDKPRALSEFATVLSDKDIRCKHIQMRYTINGNRYNKCTLQNCVCEFRRLGHQTDCDGYEMLGKNKPITRPPQSWCYVERSENER